MVEKPIERKTEWTDEQIISGDETLILSVMSVMKSAAGWYIGRLCKTINGRNKDLVEPYDRLTDYMSYEQATKLLQTIRN